MFKKILIANRGEIACRIARTCRRMGIAVATVHSEADRDSLHVRTIGESIAIGPPAAATSYLNIGRIIEAGLRVGADAIHPGYGFLAENPAFAVAVAEAGMAFIGPTGEVLATFGDKAAAKAAACQAGVPTVSGTTKPSGDADELAVAVARMQFPILLKAAAGGGGKGMRVVRSPDRLRADMEAAMREGSSAFGDPRLIVEEYVSGARHIEVQILGDGHGGVVHLFDRECSLQRRHQKMIEEAPVVSIDPTVRAALLEHAVRLATAARYRGLGTVEFIVKDRNAFFLEVNPRIQVEHPVTEEVTGLDLVELQIRAVADHRLPIRQEDVRTTGFAVEARLYAENPANRFLPSTGVIETLKLPETVRVDRGVDAGMAITSFYDPMIAKLIVRGADRTEALARLSSALDEAAVHGVDTNLSFLQRLVTDPDVRSNSIHTETVDRIVGIDAEHSGPDQEDAAMAGALWLFDRYSPLETDPWREGRRFAGWRLGDGHPSMAVAPSVRLRSGACEFEVRYGQGPAEGTVAVAIGERQWNVRIGERGAQTMVFVDGRALAIVCHATDNAIGIARQGRSMRFEVDPYLSASPSSAAGGDGRVRAPMMGRIISVDVEMGQAVAVGQKLAILESMKMELTISSPNSGIVTRIDCRTGATVERDHIVFVIGAAAGEPAA